MKAPKFMGSWGYMRFLVRAERVIHPLARVCVVVFSLAALWRALQAQYVSAVMLAACVTILVATLRWDPPFVEIVEVVEDDEG